MERLGWRTSPMEGESRHCGGVIAVGLGKATDGVSQGTHRRSLDGSGLWTLIHLRLHLASTSARSLAPVLTGHSHFHRRNVVLGNNLDGSDKRIHSCPATLTHHRRRH